MSSGNTTVSFARYRPAILVLSCVIGGCACFHVYKNGWSWSASPNPGLVRRNAVARRGQRQRSHRQQSSTDQDPEAVAREIDSASARAELRTSTQIFGLFHYPLQEGGLVKVELMYGKLLTVDELRDRYDVDLETSVKIRKLIEQSFLIGFFVSLLPHGGSLNDPEGVEGFVAAFREEGGFSDDVTRTIVNKYNAGEVTDLLTTFVRFNEVLMWSPHLRPASNSSSQSQANESRPTIGAAGEEAESNDYAPGRSNNVNDSESECSYHTGDEDDGLRKDGQSILNLLYHIAEDQARKDSYVHRGVTCNSCSTMPIRGLRYRCTNCVDFDLCEQCEALQIHPKTHLFIKIRIPAPIHGTSRQPQPLWYPGKPAGLPQHFSRDTSKQFCKASGLETSEVDALWDQFKCLAGTEYPSDPNGLGMAIDRRTFNKCFAPSHGNRPAAPNLIFDRMFAFYDTNHDDLIGFEEFLLGMSRLKSRNPDPKMRRIFEGYDLDGDGYISRKDLLLMFRAFYALSKDMTHEMMTSMQEDLMDGPAPQEIVESSQPLGAAFSGVIPPGERSRAGQGKARSANGDLLIYDNNGVMRESDNDEGDHHEVIGEVSERSVFGNVNNIISDMNRSDFPADLIQVGIETDVSESGDDPQPSAADRSEVDEEARDESQENEHAVDLVARGTAGSIPIESEPWPDRIILPEDVELALGRSIRLEHITDPMDQESVRKTAKIRLLKDATKDRRAARQAGIQERWRRRHFYLDEEDGNTSPDLPEQTGNIVEGPEEERTVENRRSAIRSIGESSSSFSLFKYLIKDEMCSRHLDTGDESNTSSLVDLLISLAAQAFPDSAIASNLCHLGYDPVEAAIFTDWLINHIFQSSKAAKSRQQSQGASRRSRSSSKVRFEDSLTEDESVYETRSNTSVSSRTRPAGERWGGYEIPKPERDVGREILYQITQEGLNELIDPIFKQREDLAMEVIRSASERKRLRSRLAEFLDEKNQKLVNFQMARFQKIWRSTDSSQTSHIKREEPVGDKLRRIIARENEEGTPEFLSNCQDLIRLGFGETEKVDSQEEQKALAAFKAKREIISRLIRPSPLRQELQNLSAEADESETTPAKEPNVVDRSHVASVKAFDPETSDSNDNEHAEENSPNIAEKLKDAVDTQSGYPLTKDTLSTAEHYDPTLPHHRPSNLPVPDPSTPIQIDAHSQTFSLDHSHSNPNSEHDSNQGTFTESLTTTSVGPGENIFDTKAATLTVNDQHRDVSLDNQLKCKLKFLAMMESIKKEDEERGGPGRINFNEFVEIMKGPKGARLGFVGLWIEMASF